jgi:hypothetical protein
LITDTQDLTNELASYLELIEFKEPAILIEDLKEKLSIFKGQIGKNFSPYIEIANKYQSLHIGCNHYIEG